MSPLQTYCQNQAATNHHLSLLWGILVWGILVSTSLVATSEEIISESPITATERNHWSFRPLQRRAVSEFETVPSARQRLDVFILSQVKKHQLEPENEALRSTLGRRLFFDLCGLPPHPRQLERFLRDASPDAYERLVDQLLASPHHGEHWAQYWLDLARYAETDGFEFDAIRKDAWKYRNWVIDALNLNMPYDRFLAMQVAGDELAPEDPQGRIATMFCLCGPDMPDINSQEERRHNVLNELAATVGSVFLGLQIGCAQCHNHKFDPVSQADFYRFRAIFEPAVQIIKNQSLHALAETSTSISPNYLMVRGDWRRPGPEVQPAVPRIANPSENPLHIDKLPNSTGRRTALAAWLTQADNPLTARVITNRLWQYHFGKGLAPASSDFGSGSQPSHPDLLDWLARDLVQHGWNLKHLHRMIVTSRTYRQKRASAVKSIHDPENVWLSYFSMRRLSGETIRDAMLASSDFLSSTRSERGVMPPLPEELRKTLLKNQWQVTEPMASHYRRSIYVFARRNLRYPIFDAFDRPDGNISCPQRDQSTTAPQSLLLLNSTLSLEAAQHLAGCLLRQHKNIDEPTFQEMFQRVFSRSPTPLELETVSRFYKIQVDLLTAEARNTKSLALPIPFPTKIDPYMAAALTDVCLAMFNSNEFLYLD